MRQERTACRISMAALSRSATAEGPSLSDRDLVSIIAAGAGCECCWNQLRFSRSTPGASGLASAPAIGGAWLFERTSLNSYCPLFLIAFDPGHPPIDSLFSITNLSRPKRRERLFLFRREVCEFDSKAMLG